jgi:hypothetical protein
MMCDVRKLPIEEILPVTRKIAKHINDVRYDDDDITFGANIDSNGWVKFGANWHAHGYGRTESQFNIEWDFNTLGIETNVQGKPIPHFRLEYYPPNGGNIRFDYYVDAIKRVIVNGWAKTIIADDYNLECCQLLNKALIDNKSLGFNCVSAFEDLSPYSDGKIKKISLFARIKKLIK